MLTPAETRGVITAPAIPEHSVNPSRLSRAWAKTRAIRAAVVSGGFFGALIGGVGGRVVMRVVFLIDDSTEGARTDSGATVGEFTFGGTLGLIAVTAVAGAIGGLLYVGLRRWLPWGGAARGAAFGVLMAFGPGVIFVAETDLQIFEPAVVVYAMFVGLILAYAIATAITIDGIHPEAPIHPGRRTITATLVGRWVVGAAVVMFALAMVGKVADEAGTCLAAASGGGCAVPATND